MKTTNYDQFSLMPNNRNLNQGLVKRLIESFQKIGYVESRPILVNPQYIVIDGQHRLQACKILGIPVCYEISEIDMNVAMMELNRNQLIWRLSEYVESWAKSGIECYSYVMELEDKYRLGMSNCLTICFGIGYNKNAIKEGREIQINSNSEQVAKFIIRCKPYIRFYLASHFVRSICALHKKTTKQNCDKVLDKIQSVRQMATTGDYLAAYENIINRHVKKEESLVKLTQ